MYACFIEGLIDYVTTEISTSKQKKFSLVTFIDTPGLVDGEMNYPFDVEKAIKFLGNLFVDWKKYLAAYSTWIWMQISLVFFTFNLLNAELSWALRLSKLMDSSQELVTTFKGLRAVFVFYKYQRTQFKVHS